VLEVSAKESKMKGESLVLLLLFIHFISPISNVYAQTNPVCSNLNPWQPASPMMIDRAYFTAVESNGFIYAIGGSCVCGPPIYSDDFHGEIPTPLWLNSVEMVKINLDGTLGTWQLSSSMNLRRFAHASAVKNNHIYAIGGGPDENSLSTAEMATINSDGTLSPWQFINAPNIKRYQHQSVIVGNYIYVIGGSPIFGGALSSVEKAVILPDGTLGTWEFTTPLTSLRTSLWAVENNGFIYVPGVDTNDFHAQTVERAKVNEDGSLGSWLTLGFMTEPRIDSAAVVNGGHIYVIGGASSSQSVERATINSDGTLSPWQKTSPLITYRNEHAAVSYGGSIYTMGGLTLGYFYGQGVTIPTAKVERANPIEYDFCLKDDSDPNLTLFLNRTTGQYSFAHNGQNTLGQGILTKRGSILTLRQGNNEMDRRLAVSVDFATGRGTTTFQFMNGLRHVISDRSINNNDCRCLN
jgi:hypothetical protein